MEVSVDLLTENQSNVAKITGIDFLEGSRIASIDCEIENMKEFKKTLK